MFFVVRVTTTLLLPFMVNKDIYSSDIYLHFAYCIIQLMTLPLLFQPCVKILPHKPIVKLLVVLYLEPMRLEK